jgi:hypothetical protein
VIGGENEAFNMLYKMIQRLRVWAKISGADVLLHLFTIIASNPVFH